MTNASLARSYVTKAEARLKILPVLLDSQAYSDVVREAQELVELALKAMLRQVGIEPPKWHDVGGMLREHRDRFAGTAVIHLDRLAEISAWLRKEREFALYGDIDFIPTEHYSRDDALRALADATFVVDVARSFVVPESADQG